MMARFVSNAGLLLLTLKLKVWFSLASPELIPFSPIVCKPASSLITKSAGRLIVGAAFGGLMVTVKLREKVLFGSDYPMITPDRWLRDFASLPIRDEVRPLILKENAARLLGLRK